MPADMTVDFWAEYPSGKVALQKLAPVGPDFRLYMAESVVGGIRFTGCDFRVAKKGDYKGILCIPIPGTTRDVYVSQIEADSYTE